MGASGWQHFVPYQSDIGRALMQLREEVFRSGSYYAPRRAKKVASVAELIERCGESGTHSVIDVSRVVDTPLPIPVLRWHADVLARTGAPPPHQDFQQRMFAELALIGQVAPLSDAQRVESFGTLHPSRATVEANSYGLFPLVPRGCGLYVVVGTDPAAPTEIFFTGVTGD